MSSHFNIKSTESLFFSNTNTYWHYLLQNQTPKENQNHIVKVFRAAWESSPATAPARQPERPPNRHTALPQGSGCGCSAPGLAPRRTSCAAGTRHTRLLLQFVPAEMQAYVHIPFYIRTQTYIKHTVRKQTFCTTITEGIQCPMKFRTMEVCPKCFKPCPKIHSELT